MTKDRTKERYRSRFFAEFNKENRFVTPVGPAMDGGDVPYLILKFLQKKNFNFY
jgi:hypothetical protein